MSERCNHRAQNTPNKFFQGAAAFRKQITLPSIQVACRQRPAMLAARGYFAEHFQPCQVAPMRQSLEAPAM